MGRWRNAQLADGDDGEVREWNSGDFSGQIVTAYRNVGIYEEFV